jgi:D-aspartate ligase
MSSTPPAVLLGGGLVAVPVARSLSRIGVRVLALGHRTDPVQWSRACHSFTDLGADEGVQDRWFEWLSSRPAEGAVVMPCNDDALELLARRRREIVDLGYTPMPSDPDVVLAMLDKDRTYELARAAGVPAPRVVLVRPGDAVPALGDLAFPCAVKPRHSHEFARHFGFRLKLFVAHDGEELAGHLERMGALGLEMLVTEIIPGPDDAHRSFYSYIAEDGRPLVRLTKRKHRQYPPEFGLTTYHEVTREPEVAEMGLRFFNGVGIRGAAVVEFKRDARDGSLKVIECNHRFTLGTEIVRHAGVDLPLIAYLDAIGRPPEPVPGYKAGVRQWNPLSDARAWRAMRTNGALSDRQWIRSLMHPQHMAIWSWSDPGPSLHLAASRARHALSRAK